MQIYQNLYRLEGRSLDAALKLNQAFEEYWAERAASGEPFRFMTDAEKDEITSDPEIGNIFGQNDPVIQVSDMGDGCYRAYERRPQIFSTLADNGEFYAYVPIGYNGKEYIPPDAVLVTQEEQQNAGAQIFAGGWVDNGPIIQFSDNGVKLPDDFCSIESLAVDAITIINDNAKVYLPGGASLKALQAYKAKLRAYEQAQDAVLEYLKSIVPKTVAEATDRYVTDSENDHIYFNSSQSWGEDGSFYIHVSFRISGKHEPMLAGQPVENVQSPHFSLSAKDILVPNEETEQGQELSRLINSLKDNPRPPKLIVPFEAKTDTATEAFENSGKPAHTSVRTFDDIDFLVVRSEGTDAKPSGSTEVSAALVNWLHKDFVDRTHLKIKPPPMPAHLAKIYDRVKKQFNDQTDYGPDNPNPKPK